MCNNVCRCRDQNEACHHVNGNCAQTGCAERYRGIGCDAGRVNNNNIEDNNKAMGSTLVFQATLRTLADA